MGTKTGATRKFLAETRREKVETGMTLTRSKFFLTQKGCTCRDFSPNLHWIMKIQSFGHGNLSQKGGHLQVILVWLFRFPLALFTQIIKVTTLVNCLNSVWIASWDRTKVRIHGKSRQFSLVSCLSSKWRWIGEKSVKGEPNYKTCKLFDYCLESIKVPKIRIHGKSLHLSLISCLSSKWRWGCKEYESIPLMLSL